MIPLKSSDIRRRIRLWPRRAFTLAELVISVGIFSIMIALVMGMVVTQSRFGLALGNYADMTEGTRRAVTRFENDMRAVINVDAGFSDTAVTVNALYPATVSSVVSGAVSVTKISYTYEPGSGPAGGRLVRRRLDASGNVQASEVVLENLVACKILYFNKNDVPYDASAKNYDTPDIKKVLLAATMRRSFANIANTDHLVSAVVTMRCRDNK